MAKSASELVIGANGSIFTAPLLTATPTDIGDPLDEDFVELGYATDDGVKWTTGRTIVDIPAWQSFYALRKIVTEVEATLAFALMQWSRDTITFALGGGTVTGTVGAYQYTPPDPSVIDERMLAVEWQDGDNNFRLIYTRGLVTENVETDVTRAAAAVLPVTFAALGSAGVDPYILQTDSAAFAAAA